MRDLPDNAALLELARGSLLAEILPLLPPERHRDLRLVATVMAIVARELAAGSVWADRLVRLVGNLYERDGEGESPGGPLAGFAADLRNGAFETSPSQDRAARAILWRLTIARLREGNPQFLAANGFA